MHLSLIAVGPCIIIDDDDDDEKVEAKEGTTYDDDDDGMNLETKEDGTCLDLIVVAVEGCSSTFSSGCAKVVVVAFGNPANGLHCHATISFFFAASTSPVVLVLLRLDMIGLIFFSLPKFPEKKRFSNIFCCCL
jgi:hypothetical protein